MRNISLIILLVLVQVRCLYAQVEHTNVFPDLSGETLIAELVNQYKTNTVLDYSVARDTLFSKIDAVGDSLECIYTGMKLYLAPGQDPTEAVYLNGIQNGINTEHSYPQGKGAYGLAQSDMHHLYPSRIKANSDRGDFPFGDIPDNETQKWYYKTTERTTPPTSNRDLYTEGINGRFEPRESSKGNIARSIFYFYTMYKSQADQEDPTYFQAQMDALCEWHYLDPVDETEWARNQKIAQYQGGKLNPFVLDCSLVSRAYCNNIDQACEAVILSSSDDMVQDVDGFDLFPNPSAATFFIKSKKDIIGASEVIVLDMLGHQRKIISFDGNIAANSVVEIDTNLARGIYIVLWKSKGNRQVYIEKLIIQ